MGYISGMVNQLTLLPTSAIATPVALSGITSRKTTMSKSIKTLPFGDRATIARQLSGPAVEKSTAVLAGALLPMISNHAAGYGTFANLIKDNRANKACPLQVAVAGLKGRAKLARDTVFSVARVAEDQIDHDALLGECECLILQALTPAARSKSKGPTPLKAAQAEATAFHAQVITLTAERDALAAEVATLRAILTATSTSASTATSHAMA